jgi:hypothetical protein
VLRAVAACDAVYLVLFVLAHLRRAWPAAGDALDAGGRPARRSVSMPALERIDSALLFSQTSGLDFERHLRPLLYTVALSRLRRRGVDAARQPQQAERLLGSRVWGAIAPPLERPDRDAPGLTFEEIESIVGVLEEV